MIHSHTIRMTANTFTRQVRFIIQQWCDIIGIEIATPRNTFIRSILNNTCWFCSTGCTQQIFFATFLLRHIPRKPTTVTFDFLCIIHPNSLLTNTAYHFRFVVFTINYRIGFDTRPNFRFLKFTPLSSQQNFFMFKPFTFQSLNLKFLFSFLTHR